MAFGDYQLEIYLQGLSGIVPSFPMSFAEWEAKAQAAMPPSIWSYVTGAVQATNARSASIARPSTTGA
jgi:lactate 2-monooxygenase